jgi:hypothetical protein
VEPTPEPPVLEYGRPAPSERVSRAREFAERIAAAHCLGTYVLYIAVMTWGCTFGRTPDVSIIQAVLLLLAPMSVPVFLLATVLNPITGVTSVAWIGYVSCVAASYWFVSRRVRRVAAGQ